MNRRELLANIFGANVREESPSQQYIPVVGGLEVHTDPLTLEDVYHLLRRIGFGPKIAQAKNYVGKTATQVVDELLGAVDEPAPPVPGTWINDTTEDPEAADLQTRGQIYNKWDADMGKLANWWFGLMINDNKSVEKLTAFWSGHWVSEFSFDLQGSVPQTLYRQLATLRAGRINDLQQLALDMTLDNAMVFYLGGTYNDVGKPNENYARELMELFLIGIGWYTEGDVKECARVLTGWKTQRFNDGPAPNGAYNTWFDAVKHDTGAKQFLGQTIPARTTDNNTEFQVRNEEVFELIKIIFRVRPEAVSRFISTKIYKYFLYSSALDVDPTFIEDAAQVFRDSNFNLRALFHAIFTSKHFFDPALRGSQIKTPIEFVAGLSRQLGAADANPTQWTGKMDQHIMDPPNVAGWPGYRAWISTNTYPQRRAFASSLINSMSDQRVNAFIREFDDYDDVTKFTTNVIAYLLPLPVSQERLDNYIQTILQGAPTYDWPNMLATPSSAASRVRNLLVNMAKAPDFQLC